MSHRLVSKVITSWLDKARIGRERFTVNYGAHSRRVQSSYGLLPASGVPDDRAGWSRAWN